MGLRKIRRVQVDIDDLRIQQAFDRLRAELNIIPEQMVIVAEQGGDFTSIKAAVDSITDASAAKPYGVAVYPGVYVEEPIVMKPFISVGAPVGGTPIVIASDPNSPLFTMSNHSNVRNLNIQGPAASSAIYAAGGVTQCGCDSVNVASGLVAFHATGAGTILLVEESKALAAAVGTCLLAEDSGRLGAANMLSYATVGFASNTSGLAWFQNCAALYCDSAVYLNNGGIVRCVGVTCEYAGAAIHTGPDGTSSIFGAAVTCFGNTLDIHQEAAGSSIVLSSCVMDIERFDLAEFDDVYVNFDGQEQGRYLQTMTKDLAVGIAELGRHTYLGQGEPYTRGMVVLTTDDTAGPASDGGNITDVSAAARSISGSTFTFQGTGVNHTILIGSSVANGDVEKHFGIWLNQVTGAGVTDIRSFVVEIWNGAAWVEVASMAFTHEDFTTYANVLFLRSDAEEYLHYGIEPETTWEKKTIDGRNLYWSRLRIDTALTSVPVFEQFRLLPNHASVHDDGTLTFHGTSRFEVTLLGLGNIFGESGGVVDGTVNVGSGGVPTGWAHNCKNSVFNQDADAIFWQFPIPIGTDTSLPLRMGATLIPTSGGAGTVSMIASLLPVEVAGVFVADPTGGKAPVARSLANTETATSKAAQTSTTTFQSGTTDKFQRLSFGPFDVSNYSPGDLLCLRLEMDDDGAGAANVTTLTTSITGRKWHLGKRN